MKKIHRSVGAPTATSLANVALYYLSRYAASEASLRRVLHNRLRRAVMLNADFAADHEKQKSLRDSIECIVESHKKSGALNDAAYAEMKVNSLRRAGRSRRFIQQKLGGAGVKSHTVRNALTQIDSDSDDSEAAEIKAAIAFARRRKLGTFRITGVVDTDRYRKDLSALARAGFSIDVARKVLEGAGEEA